MDDGGTGFKRLFGIQHRRQRIEIKLDQLRGVLGGIAAVRHDDRHRLAEIQADIDGGGPYETADTEWNLIKGLETRAMADGAILRANLDVAMVLRSPAEVFSDETLVSLVRQHMAIEVAPMGPERSEVLAALAG